MSNEIILLISSVGAIQSLFLGIYILSLQKKTPVPATLLGFLFIALSFRVAKSVLWAAWPDTSLWIINIGFAAHAAVGPLVLLYLIYSEKSHKFSIFQLLHFTPAIIILGGFTSLQLDAFWYRGGYTYLLYHQLIYMLVAGFHLLYSYNKNKNESFRWKFNLWAGIFIWGFLYFSNYELGWTSYLLGPVLYSLIIYILSFYGFRNQHRFLTKSGKPGKYRNLNLGPDELQQYKVKLIGQIERDKPYLNPDFTLSKLSEQTGIPSHILSYILNDELKQNFPDLINSYRINHAKSLLAKPEYENLKIATIAYESGFNSLSSFNAAFKKHLKMTPSGYKSKIASQMTN